MHSEELNIKKSKINGIIQTVGTWAVCFAIAASMFIMIMLLVTNSERIYAETETNTEATLAINNDTIDFKLNYINTNLKDDSSGFYFNYKEYKLSTADVFNDYVYLTYNNEDESSLYQLYIGRDTDIGKWRLPKIADSLRNIFFQVLTFCDGYEDGIKYTETASSLFSQGYVKSGVYTSEDSDETDTSESCMKDTLDRITFSKYDASHKYISTGGFGKLDISEIIGENNGVLYNKQTGFVQLYDLNTNKTNIFICSMNNQVLGNTYENLTKCNGYNNVYLDKSWDDNSDFRYRGMAVMTKDGMYYFKFSESIEDIGEYREEFLSWLGVKSDDVYIQTPVEIK